MPGDNAAVLSPGRLGPVPTRRLLAVRAPAFLRRRPRRLASAVAGFATVVLAGVATVLVGAPAAQGEPSTPPSTAAEPSGPPIGPATEGTQVCQVTNANLDEVTGMVASGDVIYAVEGGTTAQPPAVTIWTINATTCEATSETYGLSPVDPQDLALGADGALWVADTGRGLSGDREWVTLERVDLASGADAVAYRALNPASGPINGTALLLDENNQPIIIASVGQSALLFRPDAPLQPNARDNLPTLQQVGQFTPTDTDTPTPRGPFGRMVVTGAAMSPDRSKVVLRTESDAYEFTVTGGDIVAAITQGTPTITPLPNEENGQAITYSADGSRLLTLSATENPILRAYTPYTPPQSEPAGDSGSGDQSGGSRLSFDDITTIALITGFLGLVAVIVGIVGIVRARQQYFAEHPEARTGGRGPRDPRRRDRRDRRGPDRDRWDIDDEDGEEYDGGRPAWPPRPRDRDPEWADDQAPVRGRARAHVGADDEYGDYGASEPGSYGGSYGSAPSEGRVYGSGSSGTVYGSGGTVYGSSGSTYGSSGTVYGSGGTTYGSGSGGRTYGSGSRSGGQGGVYGRPRSEWDDEEPRRPYGRDNIDL
jgi:hypothetical protein